MMWWWALLTRLACGGCMHRSRTDAITRAHPRRFALGVHAECCLTRLAVAGGTGGGRAGVGGRIA